DGAGNQNLVTRSSGPGSMRMAWDQDSRLCVRAPSGSPTCQSPGAGAATFAYGDAVNRTTTTQATGDTATQVFDQGGLVTKNTLAPPSGPTLSDLSYTYDAENNLTQTQN